MAFRIRLGAEAGGGGDGHVDGAIRVTTVILCPLRLGVLVLCLDTPAVRLLSQIQHAGLERDLGLWGELQGHGHVPDPRLYHRCPDNEKPQ